MKQYDHFIDGAFRVPASGAFFDSYDPFTGDIWSRVARGNDQDAAAAVASAQAAFLDSDWSRLSATARGRLLLRLADAIEANADRLAAIETRDNGKLIAEMGGQLRYIPSWFRYFAGLADKMEGGVLPIDKPDMFTFRTYEPLGVVLAITPWNSPLLLAASKIAPALAAGNTVVLKPSEHASASTLEFAALAHEAGLPPGVLNVVTGYGHEVGSGLVTHPDVAKVTFTGGTETGRRISAEAGAQLKRASLELGGKSPNIVFADADLEAALYGAIAGIFAATGQTCIAGSRLLVQRSVHDAFVERLVSLAATARMGNPMELATQVGPVTTRDQYEKVLSYIAIARDEGATAVLGGGKATRPECGQGWFVEPTIFAGVTNDMRIAREEVFGPVLSIIAFDDEEDAIRIANDTNFGLAAGVWTTDMRRAFRMSRRIRAGTIWVNTYRTISFMAPFGGYKDSGIGRENGRDAMLEYLQEKSVWLNLSEAVVNPFVMR